MRRVTAFLFTTFIALPAFAQDSDRLFKEGTAELEKGNFAVACPKLAEAHKIEPNALGILVNLARCDEEWGKTATAYALYAELEQKATEKKQNERIDLAKRHRATLLPKLARVTIKLASRAPGESAKLDGEALPQDRIDNAFPVDPGPHNLEVSAPDRALWKHPFDLAPSANEVINVPELTSTAPLVAKVDTTPPPREEPKGNSRKTAGYVVGGAGIVALGVGAFFGIRALGKKNDVEEACPLGRMACDPNDMTKLQQATDDYSSARTSATLSTILVPVGIAAVGVGAFLVFTAPRSSTASITVTPQLGGLSMQTQF